MAQVLITDTKLNSLANAIAEKAGIEAPLTIQQMEDAVIGLDTGGVYLNLQSKTISPTSSSQTVTPDSGYNGLSAVTVNPVNSTTLNVSANGTYTATNGNFYSEVVVAIEDSKVNLQSKTATPSNVPVSVVPDTGYHGLSSVTVNPIPSNYADISNTTATANDVLTGKTFVDANGAPKTGLLVTSSYYVGSATPDSSLGSVGDLYLKI